MRRSDFREFAHLVMGAHQTLAIYPADHPRVAQSLRELYLRTANLLHESGEGRILITDQEFLVDGSPLGRGSDLLANLHALLRASGVGRLTLRPGLRRWELREFVNALALGPARIDAAGGIEQVLSGRGLEHIAAGPVVTGNRVEAVFDALPDLWQMKLAGIEALRRFRTPIRSGDQAPHPGELEQVAHNLAQAAGRYGDGLLLVQGLQSHDEYSYTHSLNVALLSVTLARHLGLRESEIREVAIAALLHDVGKERVPPELLNKAGKLTPEERVVVQRHGPDGARILIASEDVSDLAVLVAYEHHLANETDSPDHGRWPLHLVSQLVSIADVYDALRSTRPYRGALPPDQALRIMEDPAGATFDPDLFDLFRSVMGYYPPSTVVRLDEGSTAVALAANPEDPERPRVLVVRGPDGVDYDPPLVADLADFAGIGVAEILDAAKVGVDPFDYL